MRIAAAVQPFQSRSISPTKVIGGSSITEPADPENPDAPKTVKFDWGKGGSAGKVVNSTYKLGVKRYMAKRQDEPSDEPIDSPQKGGHADDPPKEPPRIVDHWDEDSVGYGANESKQYGYNQEDRLRRSHDVRLWEDGQKWLIRQDGKPLYPPEEELPKDEDGKLKLPEMAFVDVRRTDICRFKRGRGKDFQEVFIHCEWHNIGRDHPTGRVPEYKRISGALADGVTQIAIIKSFPLRGIYHDDTRALGPAMGGKTIEFDNSADNDSRKVGIKRVSFTTTGGGALDPIKDKARMDQRSEGQEVEVVKEFVVSVATRFYYQESHFKTPVWGTPKGPFGQDGKRLYDEGTTPTEPTTPPTG